MTQTKLMTADELLTLPDDGMRYELVKGEVRTMAPAGYGHGKKTVKITRPLANFVEKHGLGDVVGAETGFKIEGSPDTLIAPDVAFVRAERVAQVGEITGYFPGPPDLAVEVISPNDRYSEVDEKVEAWLQAGCLQVWVVNPRRKTVTVHTPQSERTLREEDTLRGGDLLPGFRLKLSEIFT